jgi:hypothetical protein
MTWAFALSPSSASMSLCVAVCAPFGISSPVVLPGPVIIGFFIPIYLFIFVSYVPYHKRSLITRAFLF